MSAILLDLEPAEQAEDIFQEDLSEEFMRHENFTESRTSTMDDSLEKNQTPLNMEQEIHSKESPPKKRTYKRNE